jgi:hypothetical protein
MDRQRAAIAHRCEAAGSIARDDFWTAVYKPFKAARTPTAGSSIRSMRDFEKRAAAIAIC